MSPAESLIRRIHASGIHTSVICACGHAGQRHRFSRYLGRRAECGAKVLGASGPGPHAPCECRSFVPPVSWSRGYERARIGETSSYIGHESEEAAIADAISCLASRGVTSAWVRPVYPGWELGAVTWEREKAKRTGSRA